MTEHCSGLPTSFRESASDTPVRLPHHLTCTKAWPGTTPRQTNCRKIQQWTEDLLDRLDHHAHGTGARLVAVIWQAGIGFTLVRITEGTRRTERAIKNAGGAVRYCPACTSHPCNGRWGTLPADLTPRTYQPQPRRKAVTLHVRIHIP